MAGLFHQEQRRPVGLMDEYGLAPRGLMYSGEEDVPVSTAADAKNPNLFNWMGYATLAASPGSGATDAAGYFPAGPGTEGRYEPSFGANVREGNYGTAALQGLGAAGDALYAVPLLGATVGSAMKLPRAIQRGMRAADTPSPRGLLDADVPPAGIGHNQPPSKYDIPSGSVLSGRISTRFPNATGSVDDPLRTRLEADLPSFRENKNAEYHMGLAEQYPGFGNLKGKSVDEAVGSYVDQTKDNLLFIHDSIPGPTRARSKEWYRGANQISNAWSDKYAVPHESVAGVLAALSPQKDWFMNVSLGERVVDTLANKTNVPMSSEMEAWFDTSKLNKPQFAEQFAAIRGKKLQDITDPVERALWVRMYDEAHRGRNHRVITPEGELGDWVTKADGTPSGTGWGSLNEISKAVTSFDSGGDYATISNAMGTKHKVRSFYNNIFDPDFGDAAKGAGDVTSDTHAVAANLLRPLSGNTPEVSHNLMAGLAKQHQPPGYRAAKGSAVDGAQGLYGLNAEGYRAAGKERGLLPREMQSVTWEAIRGLFTDTLKRNPGKISDINKVWTEYDNGSISADAARRAVEQIAGGFGEPAWAKSSGGLLSPARDSSY